MSAPQVEVTESIKRNRDAIITWVRSFSDIIFVKTPDGFTKLVGYSQLLVAVLSLIYAITLYSGTSGIGRVIIACILVLLTMIIVTYLIIRSKALKPELLFKDLLNLLDQRGLDKFQDEQRGRLCVRFVEELFEYRERAEERWRALTFSDKKSVCVEFAKFLSSQRKWDEESLIDTFLETYFKNAIDSEDYGKRFEKIGILLDWIASNHSEFGECMLPPISKNFIRERQFQSSIFRLQLAVWTSEVSNSSLFGASPRELLENTNRLLISWDLASEGNFDDADDVERLAPVLLRLGSCSLSALLKDPNITSNCKENVKQRQNLFMIRGSRVGPPAFLTHRVIILPDRFFNPSFSSDDHGSLEKHIDLVLNEPRNHVYLEALLRYIIPFTFLALDDSADGGTIRNPYLRLAFANESDVRDMACFLGSGEGLPWNGETGDADCCFDIFDISNVKDLRVKAFQRSESLGEGCPSLLFLQFTDGASEMGKRHICEKIEEDLNNLYCACVSAKNSLSGIESAPDICTFMNLLLCEFINGLFEEKRGRLSKDALQEIGPNVIGTGSAANSFKEAHCDELDRYLESLTKLKEKFDALTGNSNGRRYIKTSSPDCSWHALKLGEEFKLFECFEFSEKAK